MLQAQFVHVSLVPTALRLSAPQSFLPSVRQWLYSPRKDLGRSTQGRFRDLLRQPVGLLWTSDRPAAKAPAYTGQHNRKMRTHTYALSGTPTHDLSVRAIKAHFSDRMVNGTGAQLT
jgi:hypothetical protein